MVIKSTGYTVTIGSSALKAVSDFLGKTNHSSVYILCDGNTMQFCLPMLVVSCPRLAKSEIIEIEIGESSKSLEFTGSILQTLIEHRADKNALIINLGGGVVSDLGGFCASIYKRGIDFINIPTSLLAMADASVGGKTGIDFAGTKNAVGTFAQPKGVFIDPRFLKTLPQRHLQNGLAEVFKIALISDKKFWDELRDADLAGDLTSLLTKSVQLKNKIVLKDPYDKGQRKILNFGHTVGHAIEALSLGSETEFLHGEAIVAGMLIETHLAFQKKLLTKQELSEIGSVLLSKFKPVPISDFSFPEILEAMRNDKKTSGSRYRFSLPGSIGSCKYDVDINESQVKKAALYYNTLMV